TASFVTRIRLALESRERALTEARRVAARQERLASLTTLAAGAAHELATPLSAIAVAARELDRAASASGVPPEIADDARLIRSQVDRCREILDQMSGRADTSSVHAPRQLAPGDLVTAMLDTFSTADRERVQVDVDADGAALVLPVESAARTLRTLVKNAFDASDRRWTGAAKAPTGWAAAPPPRRCARRGSWRRAITSPRCSTPSRPSIASACRWTWMRMAQRSSCRSRVRRARCAHSSRTRWTPQIGGGPVPRKPRPDGRPRRHLVGARAAAAGAGRSRHRDARHLLDRRSRARAGGRGCGWRSARPAGRECGAHAAHTRQERVGRL